MRGSTFDNSANLSDAFVQQIVKRFEGTRAARQELFAEILSDVPNALWNAEMTDRTRAPVVIPDLARVIVAVDPSGARGADDTHADEIGIMVAGQGLDGRGYVLADRSCKLSPAGWGRRAVDAFYEFRADRIVAERNFGGAMVDRTIKTIDPNVPFKELTASRGKAQRAEPIAAAYERGEVTHIGDLSELESELAMMTTTGYAGDGSPNRVDSLVWCLSELRFGAVAGSGWLDYYRADYEAMMGAQSKPAAPATSAAPTRRCRHTSSASP